MVRLYSHTVLDTGNIISLQEHQTHYLKNVLRHQCGDVIQLFNQESGEWQGEITTLTKSKGEVALTKLLRKPTSEQEVGLLFAPLKQDPLLFLIEKTTELGVTSLQPILTDYSQISKVNVEKIERNCVEASQQCERLSVPKVSPLQKLEIVLNQWQEDVLLIVCLERQESIPIAKLLEQLPPAQKISFLIGPEGGLSTKDSDLLKRYPFVKFCKMGPRILRAETAAIAALTCYQAIKGDWQ